jgi:hypothetical protein
MFTMRDTEIMTLPYFTIIRGCGSMYEIQSRCTGHYWAIVPIALKKQVYYKLLHKYHEEDNYHHQTDCMTVLDAVLEIMCHDDYKLHRKSSNFEELLAKYS